MNNNIQFLQTGGVPLTNDLMATLQEAYQLFEVLGDVAGHLTILKGCETNGSTTNPGIVAINGKIFPFEGGLTTSTVYIHTKEIDKTFEDQTDKVLIEKKAVRFGQALETYNWGDFKTIPTLRELANHTHTWNEIENKPTTFPPSEHTHTWGEIKNKPTAFPPSEHTHSYNDLTDKPDLGGQVVIAGSVGWKPRRKIKSFAGNWSVAAVPNLNSPGAHKITHNLGHTDYVVTGSVLSNATSSTVKFFAYNLQANYCYVGTANDAERDEEDFNFMITTFK